MALDISTVRDALHDEAEENLLLGGQEFTDSHITSGINNAKAYWDATPPTIEALDASTYAESKYPDMFVQGAVGYVLKDQIHLLERNRQPVQAEGLSVDINRRAEAYKALSEMNLQLFYQWVQTTKPRDYNRELLAG